MTLFTPRNPGCITEELARWFGGRVPTDTNRSINEQTMEIESLSRSVKGHII